MSLLGRLADALWNPWLLGLFLFTGLVLTVGSGFFPLRHFRLWWRVTAGSLLHTSRASNGGGISSLQALATALASTIGTGSIAGVAMAIYLGGPGAVFWMWASALLGMSTGCVEKLLSVQYQTPVPGGGRQGGPMFYLRDVLHAPGLAAWFALACLPATLAGGNLVQAGSIASALQSAFGWDRLLVGAGTALLAGLVMVGGMGRVARVSERLVPAMALLYLGSGALVLIIRAEELPRAFALIFSCALNPEAALGGGSGYALSAALRHGVARGVFTNEAGMGTSAIAHAASNTRDPAEQGMWGIFEVFIATICVCSVTALVILTSGVYQEEAALAAIQAGNVTRAMTGAPLSATAFSTVYGPFGGAFVSICLLLFAFTSLLGTSYYGERGLQYLTGSDRWKLPFRAVFLAAIVMGSVGDVAVVWQLADIFNGLMALPNLCALLALSPEALSLLKSWTEAKTGAAGRPGRRHNQCR